MLGTEAEQKDLREVIKAGIKSGQEVGGYLMRYTFLDQTMLSQENELVAELKESSESANFYFEQRVLNDGMVMVPQLDFVWEGPLTTFEDSLFQMREKIVEIIGEKAMLSHLVFLPPEFTMEEVGEEE